MTRSTTPSAGRTRPFPGVIRHYRKAPGYTFAPPLRRWLDGVVYEPDGCLTWGFSLNPVSGYGDLAVDGKYVYCHRFAYEAFIAPIPAGLVIDHLCRNRACCNPAHLEAVSQQINVDRGEARRRDVCRNGHPQTGEAVGIRKNDGKPYCRPCNIERCRVNRELRRVAA